jgi:PAS domain S-box-containing protein
MSLPEQNGPVSFSGRFYRFFLSQYQLAAIADYAQAKLLLNFCLITSLLSLLYALNALLIGFPTSLLVMSLAALMFAAIAFLLRSRLPPVALGTLYLVFSWIPAVVLTSKSGGLYSSLLPWFGFIPLAANLLLGRRHAWIWLVMCLITLLVFSALQKEVSHIPVEYQKNWEIPFYTLVYAGLFFIILILSMIFQGAKEEALHALDEKNREANQLNEELRQKQLEALAQNTLLQQQQRELQLQRELLEAKNNQLVRIHGELEKTIRKLNKTQQDLVKKENESRRMLEAIYQSHMITEFDPVGTMLDMSHNLASTFGFRKEQLLGTNLRSHLQHIKSSEFFRPDRFEYYWEKILEGEIVGSQFSIDLPDRTLWIHDTFFAVRGEDGQPYKVMAIAQDITTLKTQQSEIEHLNRQLIDRIREAEDRNEQLKNQRKRIEKINQVLESQKTEILAINQHLEERVRERTHDLELRNHQLAEYAYINSHLLRAPLCSLLGLVNLMEHEKNDSPNPEILHHLKKASGSLKAVVEKITGAIEQGKVLSRDQVSAPEDDS